MMQFREFTERRRKQLPPPVDIALNEDVSHQTAQAAASILVKLVEVHRQNLQDHRSSPVEKRLSTECALLGSLIAMAIGVATGDQNLISRAKLYRG